MSITIDHKESRYDRQRRLWGDAGQSNIEGAKLLLLNANATGAEILKNLVLPGVGTFTIVDGGKVAAGDLGTNFFVTQESLGQSRAETVTTYLKELNPYVKGDYLEEDPKNLIDNRPDYFNTYTLVIAANLDDEKYVRALAKICWDREIPLLLARSYGLIGYIRLVLKEHEIVESKLDNPVDDLRISNPWPELLTFCTEHPVGTLVDAAHSHTPYLCLLIEYLQKWKSEHNGAEPKTRDEKNQFKKMFYDGMKEPEEPNFMEAIGAAFKAFSKSGVPPLIQEILNDEKVNINDKSSSFWILANATKRFVDNEGKGELPLAGSIPDMHSDTDRYVKLQNIFNVKAEQDAQIVKKYVEDNLKKINRNPEEISFDLVKSFCKNSHNLRLVRNRSLEQEYTPETARSESFAQYLADPANVSVFYLILRACDRFYKVHQYYPGSKIEQEMEGDVAELKNQVNLLLGELNISSSTIPDEYIQEMVRYGSSELHNIASLVGGVASQEIIKVITRQRVPLNNTWIFCGINSCGFNFVA